MDTPSSHTHVEERKKTLQYIKEYIFSLLKQQKSRESDQQKTKDAIEDTLMSKSREELKKKQEDKKWWLDKLKDAFTSEDEHKEENKSRWGFEIPPEDQDEYIPQDSEFGEALGESKRFAEVFPPYTGYYTIGKKSYFDPKTNLWSKRKQLTPCTHTIAPGKQLYTYAGYVQAGITAIPLPDGALPDVSTLKYHGAQPPFFQKDQNNCVYMHSISKQAVSFQFALEQNKNNTSPVPEDGQSIIFSALSDKTQQLLRGVAGKSPVDQARALSYYIKTSKKYNTDRQGKLRDMSNAKNYVTNLDASPILECYSANTLLVALCRELGIPARLVVGHMVQSVAKDGKAHLTSNNGHARTEIWNGAQRVRLDATPTTKENGEPSNQNKEDEPQVNQDAQSNMDDGVDSADGGWAPSDKKWEEKAWKEWDQKNGDDAKEWDEKDIFADIPPSSLKKQPGNMSWPRDQKPQSPKSPEQMLDEFIKKAKDDSLTWQADQLTKALEKLEQADSKEDIRKILDQAGLTDFAKEAVDTLGNQWILEAEKKELDAIDDEKKLEEKLKNSLLDPAYKQKLKEYAETIKQRIEEQKQKMRSEMERFGFKEEELALYKQYKLLEKEVMPEVRKQIEELKRILPPQYLISRDEENYYRSGAKLDRNKLVARKVEGDTQIFQRSKIEQDTQEINMFETIIIDRSGSMGSRNDPNSPFSQSVKAAITRAKVLEHFKVDMSIVIFDDAIDEVMNFWEVFSERRTQIPSKLMRAYTKRSWGNSQEPITHVYHQMKERMKRLGGKSFGNISFIGDGDLYNFNQLPGLKAVIDDLKRQGMGVTAYYINKDEKKMPLIEYYFGTPADGNAIYAKDSTDLSQKIIWNHKSKLTLLIKKYLKQT